MDVTSKAGRLTLAGVMAFAAIAARVDAAPSAGGGRWSAAAAPVVSIQPEGHAGLPYLSKPLGGSPLGLAFVVQRRVSPRAEIALEASSALAISDAQTGRFIFGGECYFPGCPNPVTSTHRDTIVNLLASFKLGDAELKAGPGLARSVTHQGDDEFNHYDRTNLVLTAGVDVVLPIGRRFSLVPSARYHFVASSAEKSACTGASAEASCAWGRVFGFRSPAGCHSRARGRVGLLRDGVRGGVSSTKGTLAL